MDLASLKAALKPLTDFGQEELSFEIPGGVTVTLRALYPREEIACQQYGVNILEKVRQDEGLEDDGNLTRSAALVYFDQYRSEVVAHALVQVGGTDFRGVTHIETGEVLDNGTRVKIPKHVAIREVISESWSRGMITIAFSKYGDLVGKIAEKADAVAKDSIDDLKAEVERTRERLKDLEAELETRGKGDHSVTSKQIRSLVEAGKAMENQIHEAIQEGRELRQAAREVEEEVAAEASAATEPEAPEPPSPVEAAPEPAPAPVAQKRTPVTPKAAPPPTTPVEAARAAAKAASRSNLGSSDASMAVESGVLATEDGQALPAYRMPTETISPRGKNPDGTASEGVPVNQDPGASSRNPNFKPPRR